MGGILVPVELCATTSHLRVSRARLLCPSQVILSPAGRCKGIAVTSSRWDGGWVLAILCSGSSVAFS